MPENLRQIYFFCLREVVLRCRFKINFPAVTEFLLIPALSLGTTILQIVIVIVSERYNSHRELSGTHRLQENSIFKVYC